MKKIIFYLSCFACFPNFEGLKAQTPIFAPGMTVSAFNSVNAPAAEGLDKAIDGTTTKFLDFDEFDGMGFTVDLGGSPLIAKSIEITTANDSPDRDPMDYEVFGSNNGTSFTSIATGAIPCISTRFAVRQYNFVNTTAYSYYRINFNTRCGTLSEMQVAEVQLYDDYFCVTPSALMATGITTTTADLGWTEGWLATAWDIEWGTSGFTSTGTPTINNTATNPYNLTGLTEGTSYDFYVRADCGGSVSYWAGPFTFSTTCVTSGVDCGGFGGLDLGVVDCSGSPYSYADNLTGANDDCAQRLGPDHMYTFTTSVVSDVVLTVCDPAYDGYIYLYDMVNGNCNSGSIASSDDAGCGSIITQNGLAAGTYVLVITTYGSSDPADGSYTLDIDVSNCQNSGDVPCDAIGEGIGCGSKTSSTNVAKTNSGISIPSCGNYSGGDIWFSTVIPASGNLDIDIRSVVSGITDIGVASYTAGSCAGAFTQVECASGNNPSYNLTGLTSGATLFTRVWENGNDQTGEFEIEITDPSGLFCLNGDATMFNFPADTCVQVTADAGSQQGCAWYQNTLDFSQDFDHTLEVYLGNDNGGGDGMTFVFHNDPLGTVECGSSGQGLGANGISNALVIEIDTYDNDDPSHIWDLAEDHIAIWTSNSGYTNPIAGPIEATGSNTDIEDGAVHTLRLEWNSTTNTLNVYFDAVFRLSASDDFITNVFGSKNVFWGSTGSTGGVTNQMYVCPPTELISPVLALNIIQFSTICDNEKVKLLWRTFSNESIEYFEIQSSNDGEHFITEKIIFSIELKDYSSEISNAKGRNYYRIKQVDYDGKSYYSSVSHVSCNSLEDISVLSDWENEKVIFNMNKETNALSSVTIYSVEGKFLHNSFLVNENQYVLDVSKYAAGIYFAKISVGNKQLVRKFVTK